MPGLSIHLIAGYTLLLIGRYYYRNYFTDDKTKELMLLAAVCLFFSIIPDFFLGTHYTTHIFPREILKPYHNLTHLLLFPVDIIGLLALRFLINTKRKPIWIMGLWAIILHITMDFFIPSTSVLI